ncbi:hypothetical protein L7F22_044900 [Adiantum nelumboides]|nr:hypothetical protein [Adiantum nelumboides]
MLLQQPNAVRPPPREVEGVPPLPDPNASVVEVTQSKEDDIEANGIKRVREKGKEKEGVTSQSDHGLGKKTKETKEGKRPRHRINLQDLPLGHGMAPYNLMEDMRGALYQRGKDKVCKRIPTVEEIPSILEGLHEEACGGHFAQELTAKEILLSEYVWPSLHIDVRHWCKSCHNCQVNGNKHLLHGPRQLVLTNGPFEKWSIDAMGPLPRTKNGTLYIIVAIDYMTRWVEAQSVTRVNEKTVSKFVYTHICCKFATPLEIVSDNGPGFRKGLLSEVCEELHILHRYSTPYYPQSNGLVEKANGIIAWIIRKMVKNKTKLWDNFLDRALWAYRTTYKEATEFTPFHLVYGQEALQPIKLNIPTMWLHGKAAQRKEEAWTDCLLTLAELEWKREAAYECYKRKATQVKYKLDKEVKDKGIKEGDLVLSALNCVKLQRGSSAHPSASRITIRFALKLVGKPYDLPVSSNTSRLTIRLADGCSKDPCCVFSTLDCVKLQRRLFEHPSTSRITIRLASELADKPYDLSLSSNAIRLTIRLTDGCSKRPCYVFSVLYCVKLQRGPSEYPSASLITIRLALEFAGKPYDLSASSNASRLADGCSKRPRCVFNALHCVKLQRGPFQHSSASRITIRIALEFFGKSYDLSASSNANRLTIRLADECSERSRCVFSALDCVKLQRRPFEHSSISRYILFTLELAGKPYDLPASFNANRITKRLTDGCSEGPRCIFSALDCVKLQCGLSEHPSTSRITIRLILSLPTNHMIYRQALMQAGLPYNLPMSARKLALEFIGKPYDLSASSNANRLTIRLADGCSEDPHCVFSALDCVKLQCGSSEHTSSSCITIRLALELAGKPYDLPTSSDANRITKRFADGCSKSPRYVFSVLYCVKLQRGPSEHSSANHITIRFALELADKPYDLPTSFNAIRLTIRLADGCSKDSRCVFNALNCVKLQCGPSEHPSASSMVVRLALELVDKPYNLPTNSNTSRITIQFVNGCSESLRCGF